MTNFRRQVCGIRNSGIQRKILRKIFCEKIRFSHYFRKKVSELSHFRQKNPDRLAKKGLHVPGETFWGTILFLKLFYILNFFVIWAQDSQLFSENFQAVLLKPPNDWLKKRFEKRCNFEKNVFFSNNFEPLDENILCFRFVKTAFHLSRETVWREISHSTKKYFVTESRLLG